MTALVCVGLSGCGQSSAEGGRPATSGSSSAGGAGEAAGAYPRTVQTRHGAVVIPERPERVVALSFATADALLSLGVHPIAVAVDPGTLRTNTPWLADRVKNVADADLVSPSGEVNAEAIAARQPDLIVAETYQLADKSLFERLGEIAPTVTPDSDAANVDWDAKLLSAAEAVDETPAARALITEIKGEFHEVGKDVPGISSKTYQWIAVDPDQYRFGNGSIFELFGLTPGRGQDNSQNGAPLSKEKTSDLDADLLAVWAPSAALRKQAEQDPLFRRLPATRNGNVYWADLAFANAINAPSPIALRWLRDELAPTVAALAH